MSAPITPASDELVDEIKRLLLIPDIDPSRPPVGTLNKLIARIDAERARADKLDRIASELQDLCDKQALRLAAAETYARRYRWLRQQHWSAGTLAVVAQPRILPVGIYCPSLELLDQEIDAALAKESSKQAGGGEG
jgi:hypothetical protein